MKTIGMLGGMSWESTTLYYRMINEETVRMLGGLHSARIAMVSVDFQEIETLQHQGDWAACAEILADRSRSIWWKTLEEVLEQRDEVTLNMCEDERTFRTRSTYEKYAAYDFISGRFDKKDEDRFVAGIDDAARRERIGIGRRQNRGDQS